MPPNKVGERALSQDEVRCQMGHGNCRQRLDQCLTMSGCVCAASEVPIHVRMIVIAWTYPLPSITWPIPITVAPCPSSTFNRIPPSRLLFEWSFGSSPQFHVFPSCTFLVHSEVKDSPCRGIEPSSCGSFKTFIITDVSSRSLSYRPSGHPPARI